jgi:hypothetical protein
MQPNTASSLSYNPFEIIHNFRPTPSCRPKRKASACERYPPLPELNVRTRKMTVDSISTLPPFSPGLTADNDEETPCGSDPSLLGHDHHPFLMREEQALENGIPLEEMAEHEGLLDYHESGLSSSYGKLERTLFSFSMLEEQMEEEPAL